MRIIFPSGVLCLVLALSPRPLAAAPGYQPTEPWEEGRRLPKRSQSSSKTPPRQSLEHRHQVGLALRSGTGYRIIVPYGEGQDCGQAGERICGGRQPVWIEVSPSLGITEGLELLLDVRFSPEADFTDTRAYQFAPGIKYYGSAKQRFKLYASGQLVLDYQQQLENSGVRDFDVALRSAMGLQYDFNRYVGLMAQGAVTLGFARWLSFIIDFGAGVQVRY